MTTKNTILKTLSQLRHLSYIYDNKSAYISKPQTSKEQTCEWCFRYEKLICSETLNQAHWENGDLKYAVHTFAN